MRGDARAWIARVAGALLMVALIGAVALWLDTGPSEAAGPAPIAWGKEPCSECHMLIADPDFAAQLQSADGPARSFDDPGCLFRQLERKAGPAAILYFHHARQDRWLRAPDVAFVPRAGSPMGYDLAAVDRAEPAAIALDAARERVAAARATSEMEQR